MPLEGHVKELIEEQQRAEEEQASQQSLKAIQKAFYEAMLALPREEYDWFDVQGRAREERANAGSGGAGVPAGSEGRSCYRGSANPIKRITAATVLRLCGAALCRRGLAGGEHHALE